MVITATGAHEKYLTVLSDGEHTSYCDVSLAQGGENLHMRPGTIMASGYAACMNITCRRILTDKGFHFDKVTSYVEMDRDNPELLTFKTKIVVEGCDAPEHILKRIIALSKKCTVHDLLDRPKAFVDWEDEE